MDKKLGILKIVLAVLCGFLQGEITGKKNSKNPRALQRGRGGEVICGPGCYLASMMLSSLTAALSPPVWELLATKRMNLARTVL